MDNLDNHTDVDVAVNAQLRISKTNQALERLVEHYRLGCQAGTPQVDFINLGSKQHKTIHLSNPHHHDLWWKAVGECYVAGDRMHIMERQRPVSGSNIDIDGYSDESTQIWTASVMMELMTNILHAINPLYVPTPGGVPTSTWWLFGLTDERPVWDDSKGQYKHSCHVIIPSHRVTSKLKRIQIDTLIEKKVVEESTGGALSGTVLDMAQCTSPSLLTGSCKRAPNKVPKRLTCVMKGIVKNTGVVHSCSEVLSQFMSDAGEIYVPWEMSLNYDRPGGIIRSIEPEPCEAIRRQLDRISSSGGMIGKSNELSMLASCDPDSSFKLKVLDLLSEQRAAQHDAWWKVVTTIAYWGPEYYNAAEAFTSKAPPESSKHGKLREVWETAINTPTEQRYGFGINLLIAMATEDNPSEYRKLKEESVMNQLIDKIFEGKISRTQHTSIAEIMYQMNGHIVFTDIASGEKVPQWYVFETRDNNGDQYKYKRCRDEYMMRRYLSNQVIALFERAKKSIEWRRDNCQDPKKIQYYEKIVQNVADTITSMRNRSSKTSIIAEAADSYRREGLADQMDTSDYHTGVINGVLEMDPNAGEPKLLTGMHGVYISRRMNARWKRFDPTDPMTIFVWEKFWNMFPKNEKDAHRKIMTYISTSLNNLVKAAQVAQLIGGGSNGKSMLVEAVSELLGDATFQGYAGKLASSWLFEKDTNSDSATASLFQLIKARFAFISETNKSDTVRTSKLKKLTSQEKDAYRQLFKEMVLAKHRALFAFVSNWLLRIETTEHGIWRRLWLYYFKVLMCKNADPSKNECEQDPRLNNGMTSNPQFLSSLLGILATFLYCLYMKYNGDIDELGSPTIERETAIYRKTQDRMFRFIGERIVKVVDADGAIQNGIEIDIHKVVDAYIDWYGYTFNNNDNHDRFDIISMITGSILAPNISKRNRDQYLVGHRIIPRNARPAETERYVVDITPEIGTSNHESFVDNDTPFQGLMRFYSEYTKMRRGLGRWDDDAETWDIQVWQRARKHVASKQDDGDCKSPNGVFHERDAVYWPEPKTVAHGGKQRQHTNVATHNLAATISASTPPPSEHKAATKPIGRSTGRPKKIAAPVMEQQPPDYYDDRDDSDESNGDLSDVSD